MTFEGDDIAAQEFSAALRGFDREEVRHFLTELADEHRNLVARAEYAEARLDDARGKLQSVQELLRAADDKYRAAQSHLAGVEAERASMVRRYDDPQDRAAQVLGDKVTDVLQAALRAADSIRAEAEEWSADYRQQAAEEANAAVALARREVAELLAQEEATVERLRSTRESLVSWLQAAHGGIGRVLEQSTVGPSDMAALAPEIHQLLAPVPASSPDAGPWGSGDQLPRQEPNGEPAPRPAEVPDHAVG
jgi:DivIVA domain-containing protein